jgi:hypothetical protein
MDTLYRKVESGKKVKYVKAGYVDIPDLTDGIWMVQNHPYSKQISSLVWKVGDLKNPVDVVSLASLQTMEQDLCDYLQQLGDVNSEAYKDAEKIFGGYIRGAVSFSNISPRDLASLFLRRIAINLDKEKK